MTVRVASWFHADSAEFSSTYAQTLGDSTSAGHFAVYERCLRVCFASTRRWNPEAELTLVTNVDAASVFASRTIELLDSLRVERIVVPNTHRTPPAYHGRWQNQFFVLDVLAALIERHAVTDDVVLLLDSDCVVTRELDPGLVGASGVVGLPMPLGDDEQENGLSPKDLGRLIDEFPGSRVRGVLPRYLGGEIVAGRADVLRQVLRQAEAGFAWSLERHRRGLPVLHEEAHLISFAIQSLGLSWTPAEFIGRMWTQPWKFRTVRRGDERRAIWHLPAEKKTGLPRLDRAVQDRSGWFWCAQNDVWSARVGGLVAVPRYTLVKLLRDCADLLRLRAGVVLEKVAQRRVP